MVPLANLFFATTIRGKVREQKGIEGGCVGDLLTVFCCYLCAWVQEAQETNAMGGQGLSMDRE